MAEPQGSTIAELPDAGPLDGSEYVEIEQQGVSAKIPTSELFTAGADGKTAYEVAVDAGFPGTPQQWLDSLVGAKGDKGDAGDTGPEGDNAYQVAVTQGFVGNEGQWLLSLRGPKGDKGDAGEKGDLGVGVRLLGAVPNEQALPPVEESAEGDCFLIGSAFWAFNGVAWVNMGDIGGPQGLSAYQLAVLAGFQGPESDWLASLRGADGIGLVILGSRANVGQLPTEGNTNGDAYIVLEQMWVWDGDSWEPVGQVGPAGKSAYQIAVDLGFQGTQVQWIASLKGAPGEDGTDGLKGDKGDKGDQGEQGLPAAALRTLGNLNNTGELPPSGNAAGDAYFIGLDLWYYDGIGADWVNYGPLRGPQGDQGVKGDEGEQGLKGDTGERGEIGIGLTAKGTVATLTALPVPAPANEGWVYSALDTAHLYVSNGITWVDHGELRGIQGVKGDKGDKGDQGNEGETAYAVAVAAGFVGDINAWLLSLKGAKGDQGDTGDQGEQGIQGIQGVQGAGLTPKGSVASAANLPAAEAPTLGWVYNTLDTGHQWISNGAVWVDQGDIRGPQGVKGDQGDQGIKGDTGDTGASLVILGTKATTGDLPVGAAEQDAWVVQADNHLYMYIAALWVDLGPFQGPKGDQGDQGLKGDTGDQGIQGVMGIGIIPQGTVATVDAIPAAQVSNQGWMYLTQDTYRMYISTGSTWINYGVIRGAQGEQGIQGIQGLKGDTGNGVKYLGLKATQGDLPAAGNVQGDAWTVGATDHLWIYNGAVFVDAGQQTGRSAYQHALDNGFVGNTAAWLASLQGPQGIQGVQGEQGIQGVQGNTGDVGPEGPQGPVGPGLTVLGKLASTGDLPGTGTLGEGYIVGLNFWVWTGVAYEDMGPFQGPKGDRGFQGIQGIQGNPGVKGDTGSTGARGSIWIALNRAPSAADGVVDDFFINTTDNTYYVKTGTTTWLLLGNLGAGNVFDAPSDGVKRVRLNGAWVELTYPVGEAPQDNGYYTRRNGAWVAIQMAPSDGKYYVQRNGAWVEQAAPTGTATLDKYTLKIAVATTTLDLTRNVHTVLANTPRTLAFANSPGAADAMCVTIIVSGNSSVTWPAGISWHNATPPVLGANFTVVVLLWDGTGWKGGMGPTG